MGTLPKLVTDLVLLHAPAVFDFRGRRDLYFPFLGTSGDVPITPLYEFFPLGFKALQQGLGDAGFDVRIVNLATLLVRYPQIALGAILDAIDAPLIGIDLHWMVHVQGSLAVAQAIKTRRPDVRVVFGGISSTYYARELVRRPEVDLVMRGYDTIAPMRTLLERIRAGASLDGVPNLLWKKGSDVVDNGFDHLPAAYDCAVRWESLPEPPPGRRGLPFREVISTQNAGCAYNCGWCGGSRDAFRRINGRHHTMVRKPEHAVKAEIRTIATGNHLYAVGSYNESRKGLEAFLEAVGAQELRSVSYEQFHLTPDDVLRRMVAANPNTTITLSPESHDMRVAKLAGRGVYTPEEMESWVTRALDLGIKSVDIWYFVGMPEQDAASVDGTVEYCKRLLRRFQGRRVNPMVCPMIPFLDPASTFFEDPDAHGYRVFFRTAEEHRRGMESASIVNRINYETKHLSRKDLVTIGYAATRTLMEAKAEYGFLPSSIVRSYVAKIDDALPMIDAVHEADSLPDPRARQRALDALGDDIVRRNDTILYGGVANQAFPIQRDVGGRWFDEFGWSFDELDAAAQPDA